MLATSPPHDGSPPVVGVLANPPEEPPRQFRVYKRRWLVMLVVVLLNLSNAAVSGDDSGVVVLVMLMVVLLNLSNAAVSGDDSGVVVLVMLVVVLLNLSDEAVSGDDSGVVVVLLNLSDEAVSGGVIVMVLWITYAPVATIVQEFYGKFGSEVNYFSVTYLIVSMPFAFVSTYIVNRMGLGPAIHVGAVLNSVGSVVKALGTSSFVGDSNTQFAVSLTGQSISAMAQSFLLFIPTKVSQIWFPEQQRTISTTIISMSNPLGIVLGEIVTPAIVKNPEDIPLNNYVWCGFALVCQVCTLFCVTRSAPPTPASLSSEKNTSKEGYWTQLKSVMTCPPYLLLLVMIGFGVAFLSAMATVTQQILCVVGYSTTFSGLATGMLILVGFVGSAVFGVYVDRTKQFTPVCKLCYGCASICGIVMLEFFLVPDSEALILVFSALFGFFGVGGYPIGLELAVEATYPVEETISTAFIFLSGQVQGVVLIALVGVLQDDMQPQFADVQVCSNGSDDIVPKDYSKSIVMLMCVLAVLVCILIIFFKTPYKRRDAELQTQNIARNPSCTSEVSSTLSKTPENNCLNTVTTGSCTSTVSSTSSVVSGSTEHDAQGHAGGTNTKDSCTVTGSSARSSKSNCIGEHVPDDEIPSLVVTIPYSLRRSLRMRQDKNIQMSSQRYEKSEGKDGRGHRLIYYVDTLSAILQRAARHAITGDGGLMRKFFFMTYLIFNVPASCLPSPKLAPRPGKVEDLQLRYFLQKDKITSFDAFKPERNLQKQYKNLIISRSKERLVCLFINGYFSECSLSVIVENQPTLCSPLTLSAFKNGISVSLFKTLHPNNGLRSYTQFDEIVRLAMHYDIPFEKTIQNVVTLLQAHTSACVDTEKEKKMVFLTRQLELLLQKQFSMNDHCYALQSYPKCNYEQLRDFLVLPCKRKLQYITSSIDKDQVLRETFDKVQTLQLKNVFLLVDEVQIHPTV
ncbi:Major facilitator superfamily [Trinorchestia longiramus]|nr:Major facilitator superfamily [Trinorchestia longiramus]